MAEPLATSAPVQAYDAHYARVVPVAPEAMAADPKRFQPIGAQTVVLHAPTGEAYDVPAAKAQEAVDSGWTWPTEEAGAREARVKWIQQAHYGSGAAVGAEHMANQLLFGVPEILDRNRLSPEEQEAKARGDAAHSTAATLGGAAGFLGGAAVTGGVGELVGGAAERGTLAALSRAGTQAGAAAAEKAVAPGLLARATSYAARGAAEGALYAAPQTVAQAAYGDVEHAAESLAWGIGTGGLVGLGAGAFREAGAAAVGKLQGAARDAALAHGIVDEAGQLVPDRLADLATTGRRQLLGLTGEGAEKLAAGDVSSLERYARENALLGSSAEKLGAARQAAQEALDAHAGALDTAIAKGSLTTPLGVVPTDLAAKVQEQVLATRPGLSTPLYASERRALDRLTDTIAGYGDKPTSFATTQEIRDLVATKLPALAGKSESAMSASEKIAKQVYDVVSTQQQKAMGEAYNALGMTADYGRFLGAKQNLESLSQLTKLAPGGLTPGGALGGAAQSLGAAPGRALAGAAGALGGVVGYQVGKGIAARVIDHGATNGALDLASRALRKISDSPESYAWIAPALAKNAADSAIARVGAGVASLGAQAAAVDADPIKSYLGSKLSTGLTKQQQYDRVVDTLAKAKGDPASVAAESSTMGHVLAGDPALANALAQKQQQVVSYLASAAPQNPNLPQPFTPKVTWTPDPAAKKAFLDKLEIAQNPALALEHMKAGSLTAAHVDALTTLYPKVREHMMAEIGKVAYGGHAPELSEGQRHGLTMLTGVELNNPSRIDYQAAYQQAQSSQGPNPKGPKASSRPHMDHLPSLTTGTQAIEQRATR